MCIFFATCLFLLYIIFGRFIHLDLYRCSSFILDPVWSFIIRLFYSSLVLSLSHCSDIRNLGSFQCGFCFCCCSHCHACLLVYICRQSIWWYVNPGFCYMCFFSFISYFHIALLPGVYKHSCCAKSL